MTAHPIQLFIGTIKPLPISGRPTGMYKTPVTGPSEIGLQGFIHDQQADLRVHGGPDKAIHQYPTSHYQHLAAKFPDAAPLLIPGSMGENIASDLTEDDVHIGDTWCLGTALIQVCQPRKPCWKIDERFDAEGMAAYIDEMGLTGWYWRVKKPGTAAPGDSLKLENRLPGSLSLRHGMNLMAEHRPDPTLLRKLAEHPGVAKNWETKILQRVSWLESNTRAEY